MKDNKINIAIKSKQPNLSSNAESRKFKYALTAYRAYLKCNNVARSHKHCCNVNETMHPRCMVVDRNVAANNKQIVQCCHGN